MALQRRGQTQRGRIDQGQSGQQQIDEERITDRATYRNPMLAILDGKQVVRVTATGDAPGHSPVLQYATKNGFEWAEEDRFVPCDPNLLPPSVDALTEALQQLQQIGSREQNR